MIVHLAINVSTNMNCQMARSWRAIAHGLFKGSFPYIKLIYVHGKMMIYGVLQTKTSVIFRSMVIFWFGLGRWFFENRAGHYQSSIQSCLESFWNVPTTYALYVFFFSNTGHYSSPLNRKPRKSLSNLWKYCSLSWSFCSAAFRSYCMVNWHPSVFSYQLCTWVLFPFCILTTSVLIFHWVLYGISDC